MPKSAMSSIAPSQFKKPEPYIINHIFSETGLDDPTYPETSDGDEYYVNADLRKDPYEEPHKIDNINERLEFINKTAKVDHLPAEEAHALKELLFEFHDVFFHTGDQIGTHPLIQQVIDVGDAKPIAVRPYRVPYALKPELDRQIQDMLDKGLIVPGSSPWSAPVLLTAKRSLDGKPNYRLVIDYRRANAVITPDVHPLPTLASIFDALNGSKYFSTLDLYSAFHNIAIHKDSIPITSFSTQENQYLCLKAMFGCKVTPQVFTKAIQLTLAPVLSRGVYLYMDDILVHSGDIQTNIDNLRKTFTLLREHNFKVKLEKCKFLAPRVEYLGHELSFEGLKPLRRTVSAILDFPVPKTLKQARSMLGLFSWYRRYVARFSIIARPITNLTKKNSKFEWGPAQQEACDTLKRALTTEPILAYPDFSPDVEFILTSDACLTGCGSVLSMMSPDGVERVISYSSRVFTERETRKSTTDRELIGCMYAIKANHEYLYGRPFTLQTDHQAIRNLYKHPTLTAQSARWYNYLSMYDFQIRYRKGSSITNADGLSRIPPPEEPPSLQINANFKDRLPCEPVLDREEIKLQQRLDPQWKPIIDRLELNNTDPEYGLDNDKLLYKRSTDNLQSDRLCIPQNLERRTIDAFHSAPFIAHPGGKRSAQILHSRVYFKDLHRKVALFVKQCTICQQRKDRPPHTRAKLQTFPEVTRPMQRLSVDITGPHIQSKSNARYILTAVCHFSRMCFLIPLPNQTALTVAKAFVSEIVCKYGPPAQLLSDRGKNFLSNLVAQICAILNIRKLSTSSYHAQGNAMCERMHRTLNNVLASILSSSHDMWHEYLPLAQMALNAQINRSTGFSPFQIVHGYDISLPCELEPRPHKGQTLKEADNYVPELYQRINEIRKIVRANAEEATRISKRYYDSKSKDVAYPLGTLVYLHNPRKPKNQSTKWVRHWYGPFRISSHPFENNYEITHVETKETQFVNVDRIKAFHTFDPSKFNEDMTIGKTETDQESEEEDEPISQLVPHPDSLHSTTRLPEWEHAWVDIPPPVARQLQPEPPLAADDEPEDEQDILAPNPDGLELEEASTPTPSPTTEPDISPPESDHSESESSTPRFPTPTGRPPIIVNRSPLLESLMQGGIPLTQREPRAGGSRDPDPDATPVTARPTHDYNLRSIRPPRTLFPPLEPRQNRFKTRFYTPKKPTFSDIVTDKSPEDSSSEHSEEEL